MLLAELLIFMANLLSDNVMMSKNMTTEELQKMEQENKKKHTYTPRSDPTDPEFAHLLKSEPQEIKKRPEHITESQKATEKLKDMDDMEDYINKELGLPEKSIPNIHNSNAFKRLHKWLMDNLNDLIVNGRISITLEIRYMLCCYVVAFIPAEFVFFFPRFLITMIPAIDKPLIGEFIETLKTFLDFVKIDSRNKLFTTFSIGRKFDSKKDLDFILEIPNKILSDPIYIIRYVLMFDLKADGYEDYKRKIGKN